MMNGYKQQLTLPVSSIFKENKPGKVRTVMMFRYSKVGKIRENPPKIRKYWEWNTETDVEDVIDRLNYHDMVG